MPQPRRTLIALSVSAALAAPGAALLLAPPAQATTLYYSSCAKLTAKFHHGVARSHRAALYQVRQGYGMPAYGTLAQKVYWKNYQRLDRDRDGTACER
jgi:hypothetical protein